MSTLRAWVSRLLDAVRSRRGDADLEEELRVHLELATEDEHKRGASPADARRAALVRSGSPVQALDALRDQRGLPGLQETIQDVRHALRTLRESSRVRGDQTRVQLGLGIGARRQSCSVPSTRFLFVRALRRCPGGAVSRPAGRRAPGAVPLRLLPDAERVRERVHRHARRFTFPVTLVDSGTGSRARAAFVTPNYFALLSVSPHLGRLLS